MRRVWAVAAVFVAAAGVARATTVVAPTFDGLVAGAETVFVGEVIDVRSFWDAAPGRRVIRTRVTFRVENAWKGRVSPVTALEFLGGTVDDVTMKVHGVPAFRVGQRDVLFVESTSLRMVSPLVGFMHGRMRIERDPSTGLDRVRTHDGRAFASVAEIGAGRASASPVALAAPMRLSALEAAVRARAAASGVRP